MARINKSSLTKLQIIRVASRLFLENGYTNTSAKDVCKELDISPGNLTFYFPTKEHLLSELVDMLCTFQWELMEQEANEGLSSVMAICLELTSMVSACEEDEVMRDFFISAYTSPLCLDIIRKNDSERATKVFGQYRPDWSAEQFFEAEVLISGIEYGTMMTAGNTVPLETRVRGALKAILTVYGVPEEIQKTKLSKVFSMDYKGLSAEILRKFREYVEETTEKAFVKLFKI
ncbi:MAG: TetR/AcrR family transcriptional regulator [Clostridia bacterium]|nr:TetR/AcrR family transcriptional regulator [Clostridia bacterium]